MKWLIASDIHGSKKYCEKLLEAFQREEADRILLLGDVLYHGPRNELPEEYNPQEVAKLLNNYADSILCVRGNCDAEVDQWLFDFPIMAEYAIISNGNNIIYATHGHKYNENNMPPLKSGDILLHGHTHVPEDKIINGIRVINPGSVSLPKENSKNSYVVFEDEFEFKEL